jgi:hypothetical protein
MHIAYKIISILVISMWSEISDCAKNAIVANNNNNFLLKVGVLYLFRKLYSSNSILLHNFSPKHLRNFMILIPQCLKTGWYNKNNHLKLPSI